ncbi:unnamed protein product [Ceratitis capitata]|uniref:(Mediterranean fruit fly) hypothetical protein n=1 Tax=Ceratitis capitata TaxID=7213 RepID=A0A811V7P2_CERCA|nr:unnamed protein product [Ceratitis capitata]
MNCSKFVTSRCYAVDAGVDVSASVATTRNDFDFAVEQPSEVADVLCVQMYINTYCQCKYDTVFIDLMNAQIYGELMTNPTELIFNTESPCIKAHN